MSGFYDIAVTGIDGTPDLLARLRGKVTLAVNVASQCGLTPQYTGLQNLQAKYAEQGFSVIGLPCNQFGAQEPGTPDEIATLCSTNYNVTFPLTEKIEVNGDGRHPLYQQLTETADGEGHTGEESRLLHEGRRPRQPHRGVPGELGQPPPHLLRRQRRLIDVDDAQLERCGAVGPPRRRLRHAAVPLVDRVEGARQ